MPVITFSEAKVNLSEGQSVLESLEQAGFKIPYSCRRGLCHSCMMQLEDNSAAVLPAIAQQGLSPSQIEQGCFLACCCYPTSNIVIQQKSSTDLAQAVVLRKTLLNQEVLLLSIQVDFKWFPGQYICLWMDETFGRTYSIASRCDNRRVMDLHIKYHKQGVVSRWLHTVVSVGDTVSLSSPMGECFYQTEYATNTLLMVGTGTGLAALYGVLLEALAQQHSAPIYMYIGAATLELLYLQDELKALAQQHDNLTFIPVVNSDRQDVIKQVQHHHTELTHCKVFLCGSPTMVDTLKRHCFLSGAAKQSIFSDVFD